MHAHIVELVLGRVEPWRVVGDVVRAQDVEVRNEVEYR